MYRLHDIYGLSGNDDQRSVPKVIVRPHVRKPRLRIVDKQTFARRCHEVCITVNIARAIHPRNDFIQEQLDLLVGTARLELGNPDWTTLGNAPSVLDVLLEVDCIVGSIIPSRCKLRMEEPL
jgi:hypothetical protein